MLSERRKADREKMADIVAKIVVDHGGLAERARHDREIDLTILARRGVRLFLDFDGKSPQPNVFVLGWHFMPDATDRFSDRFGVVNQYHHRKATDVAHGFDALCSILRERLSQVSSGEAFQ